MSWRIKPFRRTGATGQPNIALMEEGEIAVNSYDQKIWMRVGSNLIEVANAAGGSPSWGSITGTLSNQTDLANALSGKINTGDAYEDAYAQEYPDAAAGYNVDDLTEGNRVLANTSQHSGLPSEISGTQTYAVETHLISEAGRLKTLYQIARNTATYGDGYGSVFVRTAVTGFVDDPWNPWVQLGGSDGGTGTVTWEDVTGKPTTFPPSAHTHAAGDINSGTFANARISQNSVTQHQAALNIGWSQLVGVPAFAARWPSWGEVTDKPSTFTPSSHTHTIANVTGLQSALDGKQATLTGTTAQYVRGNGSLATFPSIPQGTVTSVAGGNGLSGTVTSSGSISLGTPSTITSSTTNSVTGTSHTHALTVTKSDVGLSNVRNEDIRDFGLGGETTTVSNLDTLDRTQFFNTGSTAVGAPTSWSAGIHINRGTSRDAQLAVNTTGSEPSLYVRMNQDGWSPWRTVWHDGNFNPSTKADDNSVVKTSGNQSSLSGNKTWTGNHTFTSSSNSNSLRVERTGNTARNAYVTYSTSATNIYAGIANVNDTTWGIGTSTNLTSSNTPFQFNVSNGNMTVSGTVTASNLSATSDPRLKTNKQRVKARRELIEKLEYWSYEWKKDGTKGRSVMADKVQEIAPEHVHVADDEMGTLSVDKGALALEMVFALIEKLKEDGITD